MQIDISKTLQLTERLVAYMCLCVVPKGSTCLAAIDLKIVGKFKCPGMHKIALLLSRDFFHRQGLNMCVGWKPTTAVSVRRSSVLTPPWAPEWFSAIVAPSHISHTTGTTTQLPTRYCAVLKEEVLLVTW